MFNNINFDLYDNSIIVISSFNQKALLIKQKSKIEKQLNKVFSFKIMTIDELREKLSFSIDYNLKLIEIQKNIPISIIDEMFKFSHYMIDDSRFKDYHKFIDHHDLFLDWIKNRKIYFFEDPIFLKKWINHLHLDYEIIETQENSTPNIYEFKHHKDELLFLFESIANLLNEGYDINKIYIANASKEHKMKMIHLAHSYEIPVDLDLEQPLFDYAYTKTLLDYDFDDFSIQIAKNSKTQTEKMIEEKLVELINQYDHEKYSWEDIVKLIKHTSKNVYLKQEKLKNTVKLIDVEDIKFIEKNSKCFILNATYGSFPRLAKDNEWLSDKEKEIYEYPTSQNINDHKTKLFEQAMRKKEVIYISYALEDHYQTYTAADLVSTYKDQIIKKSISVDDLTYGFAPQVYKSYFKNRVSDELLTTFSNQFNPKSEDLEHIRTYVQEKHIKLSPTHLINYIKSPFIYYVNHILGITDFETNPSINVGNYFHTLVEIIYIIKFGEKIKHSNIKDKSKYEDFIESHQIDDEINKIYEDFSAIYFKDYLAHVSNLKQYSKTVVIDTLDVEILETLFYVDKYKRHMIEMIEQLIAYEETTPADEYLIEYMVSYDQFKGKADLVRLTKINGRTYYSVVDYKSSDKAAFGLESIDLLLSDIESKNSIDISRLPLIQLLFYAQLLSNSKSYHLSDLAFVNFLNGDLKFNGIYNEQILSHLNHRTKSNSRTTRATSQADLESILNQIDQIAKDVLKKINQGVFDNFIIESKNRKDRSLIQQYDGYKAIHFLFDYEDEDEEDE